MTGEGDPKALVSFFRSIQKSTEKAADEIDGLRPPKDAEADNQAMADTLRRGAVLYGQLKEAAESGNPRKVRELYRLQSGLSFTHWAAGLKRRGYDVGVFDPDFPDPCGD